MEKKKTRAVVEPDYALMSESATDPAKRERFRRLAEELALEALELEQIVKKQEGH